jgi:hypothetical protein
LMNDFHLLDDRGLPALAGAYRGSASGVARRAHPAAPPEHRIHTE